MKQMKHHRKTLRGMEDQQYVISLKKQKHERERETESSNEWRGKDSVLEAMSKITFMLIQRTILLKETP